MNIYLIRHGRQASTKCNDDVGLSIEGKEQATILAKRLKKYGIDAVYSSNLIRAIETATIIKDVLEEIPEELSKESAHKLLPYNICEELREISFGEMEGIENKEVKKQYCDFFAKRDEYLEDLPNPGGECGQDVFERCYNVLKEMSATQYENIAVVTHGGAIRAMLAGLLGMEQAKRFLLSIDLENCSITHLMYHKKKKRFYVERVNDFAHLEDHETLLRRNW